MNYNDDTKFAVFLGQFDCFFFCFNSIFTTIAYKSNVFDAIYLTIHNVFYLAQPSSGINCIWMQLFSANIRLCDKCKLNEGKKEISGNKISGRACGTRMFPRKAIKISSITLLHDVSLIAFLLLFNLLFSMHSLHFSSIQASVML